MTNALLVIACSGRKGDAPAHALDLYRGVMYQSYRANVGQAKPHVIILSALHGFIQGDAVIVPYEQMMSEKRAAEITARLQVFDPQAWPRADNVMFAGSGLYRRVMLAALHRQRLGGFRFDLSTLHQTTGGIGMQRQQLGQWLRSLDNE